MNFGINHNVEERVAENNLAEKEVRNATKAHTALMRGYPCVPRTLQMQLKRIKRILRMFDNFFTVVLNHVLVFKISSRLASPKIIPSSKNSIM
jgi:hypothetical protein